MIKIIKSNYSRDNHQEIIINLLDSYAKGIKGSGSGLSEKVKENLVQELEKRDIIHTFLAFYEDKPVGLAICIEGFSTFECKPLMNIHDVYIDENYRGKGISKLLMEKIEYMSGELGCCKLTLEVLENNTVAVNLYNRIGFKNYELDPVLGKALFMEKKLN